MKYLVIEDEKKSYIYRLFENASIRNSKDEYIVFKIEHVIEGYRNWLEIDKFFDGKIKNSTSIMRINPDTLHQNNYIVEYKN